MGSGIAFVTLSELKGLRPVPIQVVVSASGRQWFLRAVRVKVLVDGRPVSKQPRVFRSDAGTLLVELKPLAAPLGLTYHRDEGCCAVVVASRHGRGVFFVGSPRMVFRSREVAISAPCVQWHGRTYIPAGALARLAGAALLESPDGQELEFVTGQIAAE